MQLTKEMRKSLERNLPQSTLDYLTEFFNQMEKCYAKIDKLEWQLEQKDNMLHQMYNQQGQGGDQQQGGGQQSLGQYPMGGGNQHHGQFGFQYGNDGNDMGGPMSFYGRRGRYPARGLGDFQDRRGRGDQGEGMPDIESRRGVDRKNMDAGQHWVYPSEQPARRYLPNEQPGVVPLYNERNPSSENDGVVTP